jgi:hypothetical protein
LIIALSYRTRARIAKKRKYSFPGNYTQEISCNSL